MLLLFNFTRLLGPHLNISHWAPNWPGRPCSEPAAAANKYADALTALRNGLRDPNGALVSWDASLVNPCTWFYVTCDGSNRVIRL